MIDIKLRHCCMNCDNAELEIENLSADCKWIIIHCEHAEVCKHYEDSEELIYYKGSDEE